MNYFELYPGDYLRDTSRLTLVEHGAYLRLLMAYYSEAKPLPKDVKKLYVIASAISSADKAAIREVSDRFFPVCEDGLRHNTRADQELEKAQKRIETARQNGSKGGRKPRGGSNPTGNPAGNPSGNPAGKPGGTQPVTQRGTHSGEALHTPHAIHHQELGTTHTTDAHEPPEPPSTPPGVCTPAGLAAAALNRAGVRVTSQNPNLIAAMSEGVTAAALLELHRAYPDKPAGYLIAAARRQHADAPAPITPGAPHATPGRRLSAVERVEANIRANRIRRGELTPDDAIDGEATRVAR